MKHLGDITKINGAEIPPVDCICGGSPCQDLSLAGKRAGLAGQRSGLFMEQVRIVKEMREKDGLCGRTGVFIRPRFMVWENVPGAFSSNKGRDFAAVLEEVIRVCEPEAPDVPVPEKGWSKSGCLYDELGGWSVAWRVHDAQFWGVPQRRKRISLVADFGGLSAPEILFERKGLSGNPEQSGTERKDSAGGFENRAGESVKNTVAYGIDHVITTGGNCTAQGPCIYSNVEATLKSSGVHAVFDARGNGNGEIVPTITGDHENRITDYTAVCIGNGQANQSIDTVAGTLNYMHDKQAVYVPEVSHALKAKANLQFREDSETYIAAVDCYNHAVNANINGTLKSNAYKSLDSNNVCCIGAIVRRLTPTECCRLQGYPDGWCDIGDWYDTKGKLHKESDSVKYKALGNSIAVGYTNHQSGFWMWLLKRISAQYERSATLGSLFDGIGGFPLAWEFYNGKGTALWASEIEEFPIAVTKYHFPEEV